MKSNASYFLILAIGAALVAAFLLLVRPLLQKAVVTSQVIGEVISVSGQVERRLPQSPSIEKISGAQPLMNLEQIATGAASEAVIDLKNEAEIRLTENTRFVVEVDVSRAKGLIGTLLQGQVQVVNPGNPEIRIFRDGREVSLNQLEQLEPLKITAGSLPDPASTAEPTGLIVSATVPDPTTEPTPAPSDAPESVGSDDGVGVLSNEQIIRQLRRQTSFFQRCYLNHIHRTQGSTGEPNETTGTVVVNFTIQSSGRVSDPNVIRSDFNDVTLHKCIAEVIGRTSFPSFDGDAVPVLEFPITLR